MDWDGNNSFRNFVSLTDHSSISFLYDVNNNINHFTSSSDGAIVMGDIHNHPLQDAHVGILANCGNNHFQHLHSNDDPKKKKLRGDQIDLLEQCFQEEIKLDPDRKIRLSRELGLHPRQIAVWFQNRRARWKTKQLERLYDVLKLEFDAVSREKLILQEEVSRLKAMVGDAMLPENQASVAGQTEFSGEETAESARHSNEVLRCSTAGDLMLTANGTSLQNHDESYGASAVMSAYWSAGGLPSYP